MAMRLCDAARAGQIGARSAVLLLLILGVKSDCRMGVLIPVPGASWAVNTKVEVSSIVPQFVPPGDTTSKVQAAVRPSEAQLLVETRPPLAPSKAPRLCLRSLEPVATACASGKPAAAADTLAVTDPQSFLFNTTSTFPLGPCMQMSNDGTTAEFVIENPHPESCWPGAGYCTDVTTTWSLKPSSSHGKDAFLLRITTTVSTYQDTDGRVRTTVAEIPYQVSDGCVLKVAKGATVASDDKVFCASCAGGKKVTLGNLATSSSCMRCPMRSSKSKEAVAQVGGSAWKCIPGMPAGFETIPVRMGLGGHPECASANGKNCLRNLPSAATCQAMLPLLNGKSSSVSLQPLTCGAAHAAKWNGVTGYTTPGHWCLVARDWFQDRQPIVPGKCVAKP